MHLQQAYLWIGSEEETRNRAFALIKEVLCAKQGCNSCVDCRLIDQGQHHFVTWVVPEKTYTIKQLELLFKTVSFSLDVGNHHFIVLERVDLLSVACANSLLKSLEEPPAGYHYILLAPRMEGILPTIRSRCVVEVGAQKEVSYPSLVYFFTQDRHFRFGDLIKEIEKTRIAEHEIDSLLDACMDYWQNSYKKTLLDASSNSRESVEAIQKILQDARLKGPMPGSSKIFLKNLFLQISLALSQPTMLR